MSAAAADGPTSIFVANYFNSKYLGPIVVAAYSYMALVPIVQPPIIRLLTSKRTQTAVDESGAPMPETLRTLRIIPRETTFFGSVFYEDLDKDQEVFLYGCLRALRRAGSNKSRGLGRLCINFRQEKDFSEEDF